MRWIYPNWWCQRCIHLLHGLFPRVGPQCSRIWVVRWWISNRKCLASLFLPHLREWSLPFFPIRWKGFPKYQMKYNFIGDLFQEALKVQSMPTGILMNLIQKPENYLIFGIETKSWSSQKDIPNISSALSGVSIERKDGM